MKVVGEFTWDRAAPASLVDIDLSVPKGALVAVVGQTGSGKSSLLSAALNLMQQLHGPDVLVRGKVRLTSYHLFKEFVRPSMSSWVGYKQVSIWMRSYSCFSMLGHQVKASVDCPYWLKLGSCGPHIRFWCVFQKPSSSCGDSFIKIERVGRGAVEQVWG